MKMIGDQINVKDFVAWLNEAAINYADRRGGNKPRKSLSADLKGNLIVTVDGSILYNGSKPEEAVRIYNNY